ncbi:hypothetical protein [Streptomyces sp. NPDC101455]|uniref:hypothetical protein n=1 Tax=Streptomyces sp. NPDC101455 TaxID=3366142 RepID=UPI00380B0382
MATTTISFNRPLNPPMKLALNPAHLPAVVCGAYLALHAAAVAKTEADNRLSTADPADKPALTEAAATAQTALDEAFAAYGDIGGTSTTAIHDAAGAAFHKATEGAAGAIRAALDYLAEAGEAAALYVSVRPGRAPVRLDTQAADGALKMQLSLLRGGLQDVLRGLPEDIGN